MTMTAEIALALPVTLGFVQALGYFGYKKVSNYMKKEGFTFAHFCGKSENL